MQRGDRVSPPPRIHARPHVLAEQRAPIGSLRPLLLGGVRDGFLYVPKIWASREGPLVVMLHGAGGHACDALAPLVSAADELGLLLLAPESRRVTWGLHGPGDSLDVAFIEAALSRVFAEYPVDPARIALAGFSDGASYALALGRANGDLFRHLIAFSPGFVSPIGLVGTPRVFVTHGKRDAVLPVSCSHRVVAKLTAAGLNVTYIELDEGHTISSESVSAAAEWLMRAA